MIILGVTIVKIHIIQSGETLWGISRLYQVNIQQIIIANQLPDQNKLLVGQALIIPEIGYQHIVQRGENLWMIAQRYGTTIEAIIKENDIRNPSLIYSGQVLIIPDRYHIVASGETLWSISRKYGATIKAILEVNPIVNPSFIYPGQKIIIPKAEKYMIDVNAYINLIQSGEFPPVEQKQALGIIDGVGDLLSFLSIFSYNILEDGNLEQITDERVLEKAHAKRIQSLMVITNFKEGKFDSDLVHQILTRPELQDNLLKNIMNVMKQKVYDGLNIDFEYVYPEDREAYNNFLEKSVLQLHAQGFSVSTAVPPKTSGEQKGLFYAGVDYSAHGKIVDFVVVMTYGWGWVGGPPMAVSPVNKLRNVLDYAISVIPLKKIMMGLPLYGYSWKLPYKEGTLAELLSPQQAIQRAIKYGVRIQYHTDYQAPFYHYIDEEGVKHEVWFEDARSIQAKFNLVKEYKVQGISYWVLGLSFPQNWQLLKDNFKIRKY